MLCEYLQELSNVKSSIMTPRHNTCQRISITFSIVILIRLGSCIHTMCYVKILHISKVIIMGELVFVMLRSQNLQLQSSNKYINKLNIWLTVAKMLTAMWSRVLSTERNMQVPGCRKQWAQQTLTKQNYFGALQTKTPKLGFSEFSLTQNNSALLNNLITGNSNVNLLHKTMKCMGTWL